MPREDLATLEEEFGSVPHLDSIATLDELSQAFLGAARYGEKVASTERSVALARRLQKVEQELFAYRAHATTAPVKAPVQVVHHHREDGDATQQVDEGEASHDPPSSSPRGPPVETP